MSSTIAGTAETGTILESTDRRDNGRRVKIKRFMGSYAELENVKTGRKTRVSVRNLDKKYRIVEPTQGDAKYKPASASKNYAQALTTERQRELLRIVKKKFSDFSRRQQHYYLGGGMSTTHVVTAVIADVEQLKLFWPKELIQRKAFSGITYVLEGNVMRRVQDTILRTLNELTERGHLEKVGNTDERRWKPTYREVR